MKIFKPYLTILIALVALQSCKKDKEQKPETPAPVAEKPVKYTDSISFVVNDKTYIFNEKSSTGTGNMPVGIKKSATEIKVGKLAYISGGYYWYGAPDSTLYSTFYGYNARDTGEWLKIYFTKKYKDTDLQGGPGMLQVKSKLEILKVGNMPFAIDLEKENTMEGVAIDFKNLTTKIPGPSITTRSSLSTNIQNNSSFQITKVEKQKEGIYVIEGKFEVNLYDGNDQLYRLKNGFMRIRISAIPNPVEVFL